MMNFLEASVTELFAAERKTLIQAMKREKWLLKFVADKYKVSEICEKPYKKRGRSHVWFLINMRHK